MKRHKVRKLEIHAAHACNLTCESCSHFSNAGHPGLLSLQDAGTWIRSWAPRLEPSIFGILGGEPTLNPHLSDLVRLAGRYFECVEVATNGFFLEAHRELPAALATVARPRLVLSEHGGSPPYRETFAGAVALATRWRDQVGFELVIRRYERTRNWTRRYHGYGPTVEPYQDGDPRSSWQACPARECLQIAGGRLWKCPLVAYLPMQKERWPELASSWDPGLAYRPLEAEASEAELEEFLAREHEAVCGLCPSSRQPFEPGDPLIPARQLLRASAARTGSE